MDWKEKRGKINREEIGEEATRVTLLEFVSFLTALTNPELNKE